MRAYLLTRARHGDDELFVLLSDEIFRTAAGAAVGVLFLDFNEELFGWLQCQANLAGWPVHWRRSFFTSSGVRLTSSILEIFSPASPDCIIL